MKLQNELLDMMKEFHAICEQNNIRYYMLGGTLLGAVRHKGFIPWDDDIDVGIPREDYERLLNLNFSRISTNLEVISEKNDVNYPYAFAKLCNKNTTLVESNDVKFVSGIYIDIFPLDGICKNRFMKYIHFRKISIYYSLIWLSQLKIQYHNPYKSMIVNFSKCVGTSFWHRRLKKTLMHYKYSKSCYVGNLLGLYQEREIVPKDFFDEREKYIFEDTELYSMKKSDAYLRNIYGDYMKLPPLEKQKSHHLIELIDFKTPYREYLNGKRENN